MRASHLYSYVYSVLAAPFLGREEISSLSSPCPTVPFSLTKLQRIRWGMQMVASHPDDPKRQSWWISAPVILNFFVLLTYSEGWLCFNGLLVTRSVPQFRTILPAILSEIHSWFPKSSDTQPMDHGVIFHEVTWDTIQLLEIEKHVLRPVKVLTFGSVSSSWLLLRHRYADLCLIGDRLHFPTRSDSSGSKLKFTILNFFLWASSTQNRAGLGFDFIPLHVRPQSICLLKRSIQKRYPYGEFGCCDLKGEEGEGCTFQSFAFFLLSKSCYPNGVWSLKMRPKRPKENDR